MRDNVIRRPKAEPRVVSPRRSVKDATATLSAGTPASPRRRRRDVAQLRSELRKLSLPALMSALFPRGRTAVDHSTFTDTLQRALGASSELDASIHSFFFTTIANAAPVEKKVDAEVQLASVKTVTAVLATMCGRDSAAEHSRAIDELFQQLDAGRNGTLSKSEITFFLHAVLAVTYQLQQPAVSLHREKMARVSGEMTNQLFEEIGRDHSGAVDRGEFDLWMDQTLGISPNIVLRPGARAEAEAEAASTGRATRIPRRQRRPSVAAVEATAAALLRAPRSSAETAGAAGRRRRRRSSAAVASLAAGPASVAAEEAATAALSSAPRSSAGAAGAAGRRRRRRSSVASSRMPPPTLDILNEDSPPTRSAAAAAAVERINPTHRVVAAHAAPQWQVGGGDAFALLHDPRIAAAQRTSPTDGGGDDVVVDSSEEEEDEESTYSDSY